MIIHSGKCGTGPVVIDYDGYLQGIFDNITDCPHVTSQVPTGPGILATINSMAYIAYSEHELKLSNFPDFKIMFR